MSLRTFFTVEDPQTVRLYGVVNSEREKKIIEIIVRRIEEIKIVNNGLMVQHP